MTGEEVKSLRQSLRCTARALGDAIGATQQEVMAWEREEQFPTKRFVVLMRRLAAGDRRELEMLTQAAAAKKAGLPGTAPARAARGHAPVPAASVHATAAALPSGGAPWRVLADPELWRLWRKLAAHPQLRRDVEKLAAGYADPAPER